MEVCKHVKLLLEALQYPGAQDFTLDAEEQNEGFRALIFDLEDKYIRSMPAENRKSIAPDSLNWDAEFAKYLEDLDCTGENEAEVLEFLLHLAVSYAHEDAISSQVPASRGKLAGQPASKDETSDAELKLKKPVYQDCEPPFWRDSNKSVGDSPQTQDLVQELGQKLQRESSSTEEILQAALEVLSRQAAGNNPAANASSLACLEAHKDTLGFTTGDSDVDLAAILMRLLFIKDLRGLQDSIDDAIVDVQEFTQNPRANAKLGVVGR